MFLLRSRFWPAWPFVLGASWLVACGASSNDHSERDEGDGASAGTTSGGTTGEGGGSGASSGGSGGSGPSGGSSPGGGSAGTGATGGDAGGGAGGESGSAGAGGAGARRGYQPPDRHVMGCARQCELYAEAMCFVEPPHAKCIEDCEVGILFEVCSPEWDATFECIAEAESGACSPAESPLVPECNDELALAHACVTERGLSGDYAAPCLARCTAESGSGCVNAPQSVDCYNKCVIIASAFPVCAPDFESFLDCGAAAEYSCDADGEPVANGCAEAFGAFLDCLDADYGWQPGVGVADRRSERAVAQ